MAREAFRRSEHFMDSVPPETAVVPHNSRRPIVAWQCWAAAACILAYTATDFRVLQCLHSSDDWITTGRYFGRALAQPAVTISTTPVFFLNLLASTAQIVFIAFGIGSAMAGIRRSRTAGIIFAGCALTYFCWVAFHWYYKLIVINWA
jgi:hypothetical protein